MKHVIHFCWFGGTQKPAIVERCFESWKRFCPDWEIIEWNESNFDINVVPYVREAYLHKKWAFVSDYCRFYVLYNYGGVYLDADVELLRSLDGLPDSFVGFEKTTYVNSGLIRAANVGDPLCLQMMQLYENDHFVNADGSLNMTSVCVRETELLKKHGLVCNNKLQKIDGITVFPNSWFSPKNFFANRLEISENTYSIHHFMARWLPFRSWLGIMMYRLIYILFGERFADWLVSLIVKH